MLVNYLATSSGTSLSDEITFLDYYKYKMKRSFSENLNVILNTVNLALVKKNPGIAICLIKKYPNVIGMRDNMDHSPTYDFFLNNYLDIWQED